MERLKNEITRLTAVKALAVVAHSPLQLPLSAALAPALSELTSFLRKANRPLRQATLATLRVSVQHNIVLSRARCAVIAEAGAMLCCGLW